jgi:hypothetical protein
MDVVKHSKDLRSLEKERDGYVAEDDEHDELEGKIDTELCGNSLIHGHLEDTQSDIVDDGDANEEQSYKPQKKSVNGMCQIKQLTYQKRSEMASLFENRLQSLLLTSSWSH